MTEESQKTEEPVSEGKVVVASEPADEEDILRDTPITPQEVADEVKEIAVRVKDGFLKPVWRLGRRYLKGFNDAADEFVGGVVNDKKDKK